MMRTVCGRTLLVGVLLFCGVGVASAGDYPERPIQFIVSYSAGGSTDVRARAITQPVMYQNAEAYRVWAKQASDQYAQLIKTLGIETK